MKNGDLVVAGGFGDSSTQGFLAFYKPNGKLDRALGTDGETFEGFGVGSEFTKVLVEANGSLLVDGSAGRESVLCHFSKTGKVDTAFGDDGVVSLGSLSSASVSAAHGLIAIAIVDYQAPSQLFLPVTSTLELVELHSNGTPVASFGTEGEVDTGRELIPSGITMDSKGRIEVCGTFNDEGLNQAEGFRFTPSGDLDESFAQQGVLLPSGESIVIDGQNRFDVLEFGRLEPIIIQLTSAGNQSGAFNLGNNLLLSRYTSRGRLDQSFGTKGQTELQQPANSLLGDSYFSVTSAGITLATENYGTGVDASSNAFIGFFPLGANGRFGSYRFSTTASLRLVNGVVQQGNLIVTIGDVADDSGTIVDAIEAYRL